MNATLRLFDQLERTSTTPAQYTEPIFAALNRLAWKNAEHIREVLEDWFATYPIPHKKALQSRFRSRRDPDHQGAFFELFVHQLLIRMGYDVEVNPCTHRGKTPDFLASSPSGERFYLDATVAEPKTFQDSPIEKQVFDELNKLQCPDYWLLSKVRGVLRTNPPLKRMRRVFQKWIDDLSVEGPRDIYGPFETHMSHSFTHDKWTLTLRAIPRGEAHRGKAGDRPLMLPPRADFVNSSIPLIRAVHEKARKYRAADLEAPFMVAVNALDLSGVYRIDVLDALFGWEASTGEPNIARITPPSGMQRKDCVWDEGKNTGVSAILLFNELQPHTMASSPVCLYENPWASHPLPASLRRIPHGTVDSEFIRWHQGEMLGSVLGLPSHWPGPK